MATAKAYIHIGDDGTIIRFQVCDEDGSILDISSASVLTAKFQKPDGEIVSETATFETDGSDGRMIYVAATGFFDRTGTWTAQGFVTMPGWSGHTTAVTFEVLPTL